MSDLVMLRPFVQTVVLPPVLFAQPPPKKILPASPPEPEPTDDEDEGGWEQELQDSPRSPALKRSILAIAAALGVIGARVPKAIDVPSGQARGHTAEAALGSVGAALGAYQDQAAAALNIHLPRVTASLTKYVRDSSGTRTKISTDPVEAALRTKILGYLSGDAVNLNKAATVAVVNWHVAGGTPEALRDALREILADAEWQARRTVVSEIQNAYIDLFKRATGTDHDTKIRRIVMPTACEEICAPQEGVHYADDPNLYDTHPHCECSWEPADPQEEVDFSRTVRGPSIALAQANTARGGVYVLGGGA